MQTGSTFFKPFLKHDAEQEYYTSDYDLSEFVSHKIGVGLRYSPALGIYSIKNTPLTKRTSSLKSVELRGAKYFRTDGLDSFIISIGLSLSF